MKRKLLGFVACLFATVSWAGYVDVTDTYITNADLTSTDGWTDSGSSLNTDNGTVREFYAGWGSLNLTSGYTYQEVTLPAGSYKLEGYAFFRYGFDYAADPTISTGYLFAGEDSIAVATLGSATLDSYANDMAAAGSAFYDSTSEYYSSNYLNTLEFTLDEESTINIGYTVTFDYMYSWFIFGSITLYQYQAETEELQTYIDYLSDILENETLNTYYSDAISAEIETAQALVDAANDEEAISAEIETASALYETVSAALESIAEASALISECEEILANTTADDTETFSAAITTASESYATATDADTFESIYETLEAARQEYIVNAEPNDGYTLDYTFLFDNSSDSWGTGTYSALGYVEDYYGSYYTGEVTSQSQEVPNGYYKVTVLAAASQAWQSEAAVEDGTDSCVVLYANNKTAAIAVYNRTAIDADDMISYTLDSVVVSNDTLTIGLEILYESANWFVFNIESVEYYGGADEVAEEEEEEEATVVETREYSEKLLITVNDVALDPIDADVTVEVLSDSTLNFSLKNFTLTLDGTDIPMGNINVSSIETTTANDTTYFSTTQTILFEDGEGDVALWYGSIMFPDGVEIELSGTMVDASIYCSIDIDVTELLGQVVNVIYGYVPSYTFETLEDVTDDYILDAGLDSTTNWNTSASTDSTNGNVWEYYAGWSSLDVTSGIISQEITLPAGSYRLQGYAFFRYGRENYDSYDITDDITTGYMFAGNDTVTVENLFGDEYDSSLTYANDMAQAGLAFYDSTSEYYSADYLNTLDFTLSEETTLNIGYACEFTQYGSWFIVGTMKLYTTNFYATPSDGTEVETLNNIVLATNNLTDDETIAANGTMAVTVTNDLSGETILEGTMAYDEAEGNFSLTTEETYTLNQDTTYTFTVKAYESTEDYTNNANADAIFTWNIEGNTELFVASQVVLDSASNAVDYYGTLTEAADSIVTLYFSGAAVVADNSYLTADDETYSFESITYNEDSTEVYLEIPADVMSTATEITLTLYVTDSEGLVVLGNEGEEEDSYFSIVYTLDIEEEEDDDIIDAINTVDADTDETLGNVYSINGILVKKNATKSELNTLKKGIYIVNGKKVIVK